MSSPDMSTRYLGLTLRSPVVASCSPLTGHLDTLCELDDAGVGAVVLPSLFEEQLTHDSLAIDAMLSAGADSFGETSGFFPDLADYNTGPERYLTLIEQAKAAVGVPVIASLNGTSVGGWLRYAKLAEEAGADGLELNVYRVAADPAVSGADLEAETVDLVGAVAQAAGVPVAVKLSPYWSSVANLAVQLDRAGVAGLVLFNRFYQPDLDLETFEARPHLVLSTSDELRLPVRWLGLLYGRVGCSLGCTTGVHTWQDAAKALLVGADVAMMASALLEEGPSHARAVLGGLEEWMTGQGYESVEQLKGSAAALTGPDTAAFERANYLQTLASWS